jgi:hypothetical protein
MRLEWASGSRAKEIHCEENCGDEDGSRRKIEQEDRRADGC